MEVDDVRAVLAVGSLVAIRLPERLVHAALQLQQRLVFLKSKSFLSSDAIQHCLKGKGQSPAKFEYTINRPRGLRKRDHRTPLLARTPYPETSLIKSLCSAVKRGCSALSSLLRGYLHSGYIESLK